MALKKEEAVITEVLKMIAPGTPIRDGLENILKAKTGALIVIGDTKEVLELVDGGFQLDVEYTSSRLYELAKMDGAIVLSSDLKKILYANTQIIPSSSIITKTTPVIIPIAKTILINKYSFLLKLVHISITT